MDTVKKEALLAASAAAWSLLSTLASCCGHCFGMHAIIARQQQSCITRSVAHLPGGPALHAIECCMIVATGLLEASAPAQSGCMRPRTRVL